MLVLLTSADISLLFVFWGIAFSFLGMSVMLCLVIVFRRVLRNRHAKEKAKAKADFQEYLAVVLNKKSEVGHDTANVPLCSTSDMASVFLHYFRTLKGEKKEYLQELISGSIWERALIENTYKGVRGVRMRCLRALSYLGSQRSLQVIFDNLVSEDKYIRLTSARCLVRRKSFCYLGPIVESLRSAFPQDHRLISGILAGVGSEGVSSLESFTRRSSDSIVKTACLKALAVIMPARTTLDLTALMSNESDAVRAAALSLSAVTEHDGDIDPLLLGLADSAAVVKIQAAKMACNLKRSDITAELYKLTNDPVMWVRYWSIRAIWSSGRTGQKFVSSLASKQKMAEKVSLEMRSGYV